MFCGVKEHLKPVKDLGVWIDPELTMNEQLRNLCRVCFYQLPQIRSNKKYLTRESLITLIHSFVCTKIHYCKSVFYGVNLFILSYVQST